MDRTEEDRAEHTETEFQVTCASCGRKSPWHYGPLPVAYLCGQCADPVSEIVIAP